MDDTVYRVVGYRQDGTGLIWVVGGPYADLSTARGVRTYNERRSTRSDYVIQALTGVWENVS